MLRRRHSTLADRGVIIGLRRAGLTCEQIAAHPDVHFSLDTVRRWVQRYDDDGYEGLKTKPRTGRPKVVQDDDLLLITATIQARPHDSLKDIVQELTPHLGPHMCSVYERVAAAGLHCRTAAIKPLLTEVHKQQRLEWAYNHRNMTVEDWNATVFSDETSHRSSACRATKVWRRPGTRYETENVVRRRVSGRISLMQWFAFSGDLGSIAVLNCPGRMNARFYRDTVLEGTLLPRMEQLLGQETPFKFVQDNAGIHTAHIVRDWFVRHPFVQKIVWAANSPDMNPIENVFGLIALEWDPRYERNAAALEAHALEVFASIQRRPQIFRTLASSMPRRIEALIDANGDVTKY